MEQGQVCLIRSPRGTELGKVLCEPRHHEGDVVWVKNSKTHGERVAEGKDLLALSGEILRLATEEDIDKVLARDVKGTREEEAFCRECIERNGLSMKLAGVEYLYEGEKIIFYFLADGRVDFRNLVKDLAKQYRTRIEMKQIGVRDEARLLAEFEHCGRRLCCKNFLNNLDPVTMKMAKAQKTTLDPSKISGRCGRLMCCLRYEDHVYQELKDNLPKKGCYLVMKDGSTGRVLNGEVLLQTVLIDGEDGALHTVAVGDIAEVLPKGQIPAPRRPPSARGGSGSRRGNDRPGGDRKSGDRNADDLRTGDRRGTGRRGSRRNDRDGGGDQTEGGRGRPTRSRRTGQEDRAGAHRSQEGRTAQDASEKSRSGHSSGSGTRKSSGRRRSARQSVLHKGQATTNRNGGAGQEGMTSSQDEHQSSLREKPVSPSGNASGNDSGGKMQSASAEGVGSKRRRRPRGRRGRGRPRGQKGGERRGEGQAQSPQRTISKKIKGKGGGGRASDSGKSSPRNNEDQ